MFSQLGPNDDKIPQPPGLRIPLMEHQKTSICAMTQFSETPALHVPNIEFYGPPTDFTIRTSIGILGDSVGFGKSYMIIGLMLHQTKLASSETHLFGSPFVGIYSNTTTAHMPVDLLIIPNHLLSQWTAYLEQAPGLRQLFITTGEQEIGITPETLSEYDVVVLTCKKTRGFFDRYRELKWRRIFIDEADSVALSKNTHFNTSFLWLVTGTPSGLRSGKGQIGQLFHKLEPWAFDWLIIRNDPVYVKECMKLPPPNKRIIQCLTPQEVYLINELVTAHIMSMINAGNTKEAIRCLNCNVDTEDNILKVITANIEEEIENKQLELECLQKKKFRRPEYQEKQKMDIIKLERNIQRLKTRVESVKEKIMSMNDEYCPICMDELTDPTLLDCCKTIFCFECLTLTTKKIRKCPHCREKFTQLNMHIIRKDDNHDTDSATDVPLVNVPVVKDKLDTLMDLLRNNPTGKFLVFADFQATFLKIKLQLQETGITHEILSGNESIIQHHLDAFRNGKIQVIMLNAHHFGAGMNIECATHVVIYHRFTAEMEEQVIGRAQRPGRTQALEVVYLIHANETQPIEEPMNDAENIE